MSREISPKRLFQIIEWLIAEAVPVPGRILLSRQGKKFFIIYEEPNQNWPGGIDVKKPIIGQGSFASGKVEFSTAELSDDVVVESQAIPILAKIFERIGFAQTSNGEGNSMQLGSDIKFEEGCPTWLSLAALVPSIISPEKLTEKIRARVPKFDGTMSFGFEGELAINLALNGNRPFTVAKGDAFTFEFLNGMWLSDPTLKEVIQCAADYVRMNGWEVARPLPPGLK